jgi:polyhydroxyalkanoate synthesis regulator phasin
MLHVLYNIMIKNRFGVIHLAKSKAKKTREKLVREGRRNPEESRSPFVFSDMRTRKTKTKKDYFYRNKNKNHSSTEGKDGSCYFFRTFIFLKQS